MFSTYISKGKIFNEYTDNVAFIVLINLVDGREYEAVVPGGSLEVAHKVDNWLHYKDTLSFFQPIIMTIGAFMLVIE